MSIRSRCRLGGLDVIDKERGGASVIATAAVAVRLDLKSHIATRAGSKA
jgi:hypothetical protein